jgi:hypothetical protein
VGRRRSEAAEPRDARPAATRAAAQTFAYDAFVSYSHAWDKDVAKAFQNALQDFDRPWYRPRSLKLFRDETNLGASPHLWREIEEGLTRSRWLVVMASPSAAASLWVRQEIRWWLTHRSAQTLLIGTTRTAARAVTRSPSGPVRATGWCPATPASPRDGQAYGPA